MDILDINKKVNQIIQKDCGLDIIIKANDNIDDIGINSFNFVKIIVDLENEFNIEFPDEALFDDYFNTSNEIASFISKLLTSNV